MKIGSLLTDRGITIYHRGQITPVDASDPKFERVKQVVREGNGEALEALLRPDAEIQTYILGAGRPDIMVERGRIQVGAYLFGDGVSTLILKMLNAGAPPEPLVKFLDKVLQNDLVSAREETLLFSTANDCLISDEGDIIAFKGVRDTYYDVYSNTIDNTVGQSPSMSRRNVDPRRHVTCAPGLHFGSRTFADNWGPRTMVVAVNPANVVAIPNDYGNQKGRCCGYTVIAEIPRGFPVTNKATYSASDFVPAPEPTPETPVPTNCEKAEAMVANAMTTLFPTLLYAKDSTFDELNLSRTERESLLLVIREELQLLDIEFNQSFTFGSEDDIDLLISTIEDLLDDADDIDTDDDDSDDDDDFEETSRSRWDDDEEDDVSDNDDED